MEGAAASEAPSMCTTSEKQPAESNLPKVLANPNVCAYTPSWVHERIYLHRMSGKFAARVKDDMKEVHSNGASE
jgi:hypothetical protein